MNRRLPRTRALVTFVVAGALAFPGQPVRAEEPPAPVEPPAPAVLKLPLFGESTFSATSTSTLRGRGDNYDLNPYDDDFVSGAQRFDLTLQGESARLDLRLDGFLPAFPGSANVFVKDCPEAKATLCYLKPLAQVERLLLRIDQSDFTAEIGDAYAVLGRGLALTMRKADLLGVDNALRGLHLRWDDGRSLVKVHAGVANPQNLDPTNLSVFRDPLDVVAGAEAKTLVGPGDLLEVGGQATWIQFEDLTTGATRLFDRQVVVGGGRLAAPSLLDGKLAMYLEGNLLQRAVHGAEATVTEDGSALYGSAQLQLDNVTLLGEWVDYRNFMVAPTTLEGTASRIYGAAPTMELDGLQRLRAVGNRRGGSLKLDWAFLPAPWSVSANALVYGLNEDPKLDPFDGVLVTHGWLGVRRFNAGDEEVGWTFEALAGVRRETFLHDPLSSVVGTGDLDRQVIHFEVDGSIAKGAHSIEGRLDHRFEKEFRFRDYTEFMQGGITFTYTWALKLSVSPSVRWNTERQSVIDARAAEMFGFLGGALYPSLEVRWNFSPGDFIGIFAGSTPAGRICSGGVCRDVQSFEGVTAQVVLRF